VSIGWTREPPANSRLSTGILNGCGDAEATITEDIHHISILGVPLPKNRIGYGRGNILKHCRIAK
jgi:hypothetical protein